jgi:hypothetical protein
LPDLDLRPDHTGAKNIMVPRVLPLFGLFALFSVTIASQFLLRPPAGYGASYDSPDKSFRPLHSETAYASYEPQEELYTWEPPTEAEIPELSALSEEYFTRVGLAMFPDHSIRIKKSADWCDSSVKHVALSSRYQFPKS